MIREFKTSKTAFNSQIGLAIFMMIATIVAFLILNVIISMLVVFAIFWAILAFWSKDRVLITFHKEYIEAKEAMASKKKLVLYNTIKEIEVHRTGKIITLFLKDKDYKGKVRIGLQSIDKEERIELIELIKSKII